MNCSEFCSHIQRYFDADLNDLELSGFETHLSACPSCQKTLEEERFLEQSLRRHVHPKSAPEDLCASVLASLEKSPSVSFGESLLSFLFRPAFVAGLALVVMIVVIVSFRGPDSIYAQASHEYMANVASPASSSDMDKLVKAFSQTLGYPVSRPHVDVQKIPLVGARIIEFRGKGIAQFIFEKDGQRVSAFMLPPDVLQTVQVNGQLVADETEARVTAMDQAGLQQVMCFHKTTRDGCLIVSSMPREKLLELMG